MADKITLSVAKRSVTGKKNRFLRRQGVTPCHIYGNSINSEAFQTETAELENVIATAGKTRLIALNTGVKKPRMAFIREIQRTPVGGELLHVDFYQVKMTEKITAKVPVHLTGEAPALKAKGRMLAHPQDFIEVESLPADIPASISVDLSVLETLDDAIFVKDLELGENVTLLTDPETLIAKVNETSVKTEVEEEEEAAAEEAEEAAEAESEATAEAEENS